MAAAWQGRVVRDRLEFGIQDANVQSQFLRIDVKNLALEKALSHYRSEVTETQLKEIKELSSDSFSSF